MIHHSIITISIMTNNSIMTNKSIMTNNTLITLSIMTHKHKT
jgi:hypothetical protein